MQVLKNEPIIYIENNLFVFMLCGISSFHRKEEKKAANMYTPTAEIKESGLDNLILWMIVLVPIFEIRR
jgi:hypothetical protein